MSPSREVLKKSAVEVKPSVFHVGCFDDSLGGVVWTLEQVMELSVKYMVE